MIKSQYYDINGRWSRNEFKTAKKRIENIEKPVGISSIVFTLENFFHTLAIKCKKLCYPREFCLSFSSSNTLEARSKVIIIIMNNTNLITLGELVWVTGVGG